MGADQVPPALLRAAEAAAHIDGVEWRGEWTFDGETGAWTRRCRLTRSDGAAGPVPVVTAWYVLVQRYPWGEIEFKPAVDGGIADTFWHQMANDLRDGQPWRTGHLCLTTPGAALGRLGDGAEPWGAEDRLSWHCQRALGWLALANAGELRGADDPYELPPLPGPSSAGSLAYVEDGASYEAWQRTKCRAGYAQLWVAGDDRPTTLVLGWLDGQRQPTGPTVDWGRWRDQAAAAKLSLKPKRWSKPKAIFIRLSGVPTVRLARLPLTWGELARACADRGCQLDAEIQQLAGALRDGRQHYLLLGAPLPAKVGEPPRLMHWFCLRLPVLSWGAVQRRGFRPGSKPGYDRRDRAEVFRAGLRLDWVATANWDRQQRAARGVLAASVRRQTVAMVGAGALGSLLAENLVRGGVEDLRLIDYDRLEVGNLVRHTLGLSDLGTSKATALAQRLNDIAPQGRVVGLAHAVLADGDSLPEPLAAAGLVIDASGSDEVLHALAEASWPEPVLFVSVSVSWCARHLLLFAACGCSFPADVFEALLSPWRDQSLGAEAEPLVWEGIGCWHPAWPGRYDHLAALAGCATGLVERLVKEPPTAPTLFALERTAEGGIAVVRTALGQEGR